MKRNSHFHFLRIHIEEKLNWHKNTTQVVWKVATRQRLHFLRINYIG